jgi:hypothetical protein
MLYYFLILATGEEGKFPCYEKLQCCYEAHSPIQFSKREGKRQAARERKKETEKREYKPSEREKEEENDCFCY